VLSAASVGPENARPDVDKLRARLQ
jgi:hypothetical protein